MEDIAEEIMAEEKEVAAKIMAEEEWYIVP
jgi:hypothetical protein